MTTEKKKKWLWRVAVIFSLLTLYCLTGIIMVGSLAGAPNYSNAKLFWHETFYSIGAIVSFLITFVSLIVIAIWKLRNQK
jgi:type IV secretory pathway component VirB8